MQKASFDNEIQHERDMLFNPSPHTQILASSFSAANKDMMSKIWKNGYTIIRLS